MENTIQDYLRNNKYLPQLLNNIDYSDKYRKWYNNFISNVQGYCNLDFDVCFIARTDEIETFRKELYERKLLFWDSDFNKIQELSNENDYLINYSNGFKEGFNNLKLSNMPDANELIKILDLVNDKYISEKRSGILKYASRNDDSNKIELLRSEDCYREGVREGKKYKSRFLVMENYLIFKEFKPVSNPFHKSEKQIESLELEKASHKILILHELGILDHLTETYEQLKMDKNTSLSKLLAPILNEKTETIRGALKHIHTGGKGIINPASVRKVKAELSKLGIKTKTLPDL